MIFTDWVKDNCMENPSIITKEDFDYFDSLVWHDKGKTFNSLIYRPKNVTLWFNKGFVIFSIDERNTDYYNNDRVCDLICFYKARDSKLERKECLDNFWHFLRVNKCTKVNMSTKINPEFWIKNYDFKLKRYEMELDL